MKKLIVITFHLLITISCFGLQAQDKIADDIRTKEIKNLKFGMFVCWSFSTFSGYEWTPGVSDISFFNPTGCDTDQWCQIAKEAGMKYILFLTKHHDGFCLWDTKTTERKVGNTSALKGRDILAELKKSCDKYDLKLALYFSEGDWSWNPSNKGIHQSVARPNIKKAQLKELLSNYGKIEFFWFDHAINDGGLNHTETVKWVHHFQPNTFCGFNAGSTAGRLNLRERGKAGPIGDKKAVLHKGYLKTDYSNFTVAEFTYPILEGQTIQKMRGAQWFYSLPENDEIAASPEKIYNDYLAAVKFGNLFSLDVGPDRSGKLRKIDIKTLKKVGQYIRNECKIVKLVKIKSCKASTIWGADFNAENAIDGKSSTRWGAKDGSRSGWLEINLEKEEMIVGFKIDEADFKRITEFELQIKLANNWQTIFKGRNNDNVKHKIKKIAGKCFRLMINKANEVPTITEFTLFTE